MRLTFLLLTILLLNTSFNLFAQNEQNSTTIFEDFPWLSAVVDINDCQETEVTVFSSVGFTWALVETPFGRTIYDELSRVQCTDPLQPIPSCVDFFILEEVFATWTCPESDTPKPGCTDTEADNFNPTASQDDGSCIYDRDDSIFEQYPWLAYYFNPENCTNERVTIYDYQGEQEAYVELSYGTFIIKTAFNGPFLCFTKSLEEKSCVDSISRNISNAVEVWACDGSGSLNETEPERQTIIDVIANSEDHETLHATLETAGLIETLSGEGPFTVFAPTDDAFAALPDGTMETLMEDPTGDLTSILLNHVLDDHMESSGLTNRQTTTTLNGTDIKVTIGDNGIFINDAKVMVSDIVTDNGVVHVIDALLLPPVETKPELFETYSWLNNVINVSNCTNERVSIYQAGTYFYAYIEGTDNNGQLYTKTGQPFCSDPGDFSCLGSYGISNLIDGWTCPNRRQTVVDVITESEVHQTLKSAIITAGLTETLSGEGPFTVFAPTDNAFKAIPQASIEALLGDAEGSLTDLLLYHVLGTNVLSSNLSDGQRATTLSGIDVLISITNAGVVINDALVTVADIETENGVVHVIDAVLLPPSPEQPTVFDIIANSVEHNIFEEVLEASGYSRMLSEEESLTVFAPTDEAFAALPQSTTALLLSSTGELREQLIVAYHIVRGQFESSSLADGQRVKMLNFQNINVSIDDTGIFINDAKVTITDIVADNGIVHVIDAVLLPSHDEDVPAGTPVFETYNWLNNVVNLSNCGNEKVTVYESGFIDFQYIYVENENGGSLYSEAGLSFCTSRENFSCVEAYQLSNVALSWTCPNNDEPTPQTVYDVIVESEDHNTLEAAIIAAGLEETLNAEQNFTVFAPTDAAFAALPEGTLDALLADPTGELTQILLYHVLGFSFQSKLFTERKILETVNGAVFIITVNDNGIFINDAKVMVTDIVTSNGVVHVIDAVLLPSEGPETTDLNIIEVLSNTGVHYALTSTLITAGLIETLSGEGSFTIFAPIDMSVGSLPIENGFTILTSDGDGDLTEVLLYHVLDGQITSTSLSNDQSIATLNGANIEVSIDENGIFINDAQVTTPDIVASNGVIHIIDSYLFPPGFSFDPPPVFQSYEWLSSVVDQENCSNTKVTVYASGISRYVFIEGPNGQTLYTDFGTPFCTTSSSISCADAYSLNITPVITSWTCPDYVEPTRQTVFDVIAESEVHTSLESAITIAGLTETLSGEGPFTVFAPTDDAFRALPSASLGALFVNTSSGLTDLLLYHVLGANVLSSNLSDGQIATTLGGADIKVRITDAGVLINDALVTIVDIVTENGVVHVIDAVLLPPPPEQASVFDIIANSVEHNILEETIKSAGLAKTLSGEGSFTVFAPTDEAFVAIPQDLLTSLLSDPTGDLTDILLYHVLGAQALSTSLTDRQTTATLNGAEITITINEVGVFINDAKVTVTDIVGNNGVVHIIDAVLIPSAEPEQPVESLIFETYNWLSDVLNLSDCANEKVTVYESGFQDYQYIYIESENGGTLYTDYGLSFCTSSENSSCVDTYRLSTIADSWSCADGGVVNPPPVAGELPQDLKDLDWLNNIIDLNNCAGSSIELYDFGSYSFVYVTVNGATSMYLNNGTFYCEDGSSYNCKLLYGISRVADVVWNCGGANKNTASQSYISLQKTAVDNWNYGLYPNPTKGLVYLELSAEKNEIEQIYVYDMMGKVVLSQSLENNTSNHVQLDLSNQPKGLYLVELTGDKTRLIEKLIIE